MKLYHMAVKIAKVFSIILIFIIFLTQENIILEVGGNAGPFIGAVFAALIFSVAHGYRLVSKVFHIFLLFGIFSFSIAESIGQSEAFRLAMFGGYLIAAIYVKDFE